MALNNVMEWFLPIIFRQAKLDEGNVCRKPPFEMVNLHGTVTLDGKHHGIHQIFPHAVESMNP